MKALQKNWLLLIKSKGFFIKKQKTLLCFLLFYSFLYKAQIANYVNNGSFEDCVNCNQNFQALVARYWSGIDTNKYCGFNLSELPPTGQVPHSSFTYQWPRTGNNYFLSSLLYKPNTTQTTRGYPRNRLKGFLQAGHTYCIKFYYNITNQSPDGVDGLGVYLGDLTTDTISQCDKPIPFLTPQIQNPANNIISDTLNWLLMSGTYTANGTEKYLILGNFKSDMSTNTVVINPANLPLVGTDVLYDDVSVIDINLAAYAGPDIFGIPTTTVYLGRPQDVGIDEACMWYHLPNTTTVIDTAAGITITVAATTQTYMVKQDICGNIKYDTVVVYASATGMNELKLKSDDLRISPNPASDKLNIQFTLNGLDKEFTKAEIVNSIGQLIKEINLNYDNKQAVININELPNGVYLLNIKSDNQLTVSKRFVVSK